MWDVKLYHRFQDERSQSFFDLLAHVQHEDPRQIVDLGCGSGELSAAMLSRWPNARIHGVDNSKEMIAAAALHAIPERLSFEFGDLAVWSPTQPLDVIVANASIHWVGEHEVLLPRLINILRPGGVLAFQVPANFDAPSHRLIAELCASERWAPKLALLAEKKTPVQASAWYLAYLLNLGLETQVWETTYYHVFQGEDPVLEWTSGTALRPVLGSLTPDEQAEFRGQYGVALREAYPKQTFGTVFPFRRIFAVARK